MLRRPVCSPQNKDIIAGTVPSLWRCSFRAEFLSKKDFKRGPPFSDFFLKFRGFRENFRRFFEYSVAAREQIALLVSVTRLPKQSEHGRHLGAGLENTFKRLIFRDFAVAKPYQLPTFECSAPHGTAVVNCTPAPLVRGARLEKQRLAPLSLEEQSERGKLLRRIARLEHHSVEKHAVATHPAGRTKTARGFRERIGFFGGGFFRRTHLAMAKDVMILEILAANLFAENRRKA